MRFTTIDVTAYYEPKRAAQFRPDPSSALPRASRPAQFQERPVPRNSESASPPVPRNSESASPPVPRNSESASPPVPRNSESASRPVPSPPVPSAGGVRDAAVPKSENWLAASARWRPADKASIEHGAERIPIREHRAQIEALSAGMPARRCAPIQGLAPWRTMRWNLPNSLCPSVNRTSTSNRYGVSASAMMIASLDDASFPCACRITRSFSRQL